MFVSNHQFEFEKGLLEAKIENLHQEITFLKSVKKTNFTYHVYHNGSIHKITNAVRWVDEDGFVTFYDESHCVIAKFPKCCMFVIE